MHNKRLDQLVVFGLTWLSYAALYLTRKNFSVIKSSLHSTGVSVAALGMIDTCYLSIYAFGQFFSGWIGDRIGAKKVIVIGLFGSALTSFIFGYSNQVIWFALLFGINGFFQSTGWSNNVKALEPWFAKENRGKILGLWGTNQQVGGLCATLLAAFLLSRYGWQWAFLGPAMFVAAVGLIVYFFLIEPAAEMAIKPDVKNHGPTYRELWTNPLLWCLSLSYFGLKMIRYSLLFWLPFYFHQSLNIKASSAAYFSILFEVGGVLGSIITGWLADRYFKTMRIRLVFFMVVLLSLLLYFYRVYAAHDLVINGLLIILIGLLVCGPDALMSGACAQDLGGKDQTASVAGIINGIGSMGAMLQGLIIAYVSSTWGWSAVFYLFFVIATFSALFLLPFFAIARPRYANI